MCWLFTPPWYQREFRRRNFLTCKIVLSEQLVLSLSLISFSETFLTLSFLPVLFCCKKIHTSCKETHTSYPTLLISLLQPSGPKVTHTDLHFSTSNVLPWFQRLVTFIPFFLKPCRLRIRFVRQDLTCVDSFENLPTHEEVNGIQPVSCPRLPISDSSHPSLSSSNRVSRPHTFTPQSPTENTLSGILTLRGSCSTSTDSKSQTGFGLCP
jgi:hypothetical protein